MPIRIAQAEFFKSMPHWDRRGFEEIPHICFMGRSNVGKSSLLNALAQRKKLARTSARPGCTQHLVFFRATLTDGAREFPFYLADLPGYGFAQAPEEVRRAWRPMMAGYIYECRDIACCVFLLDIRRRPNDQDMDILDILNDAKVPVLPVLTKADKVARGKQRGEAAAIARELEFDPRDLRITSADSRDGIDEVLGDLFDVLAGKAGPEGEA